MTRKTINFQVPKSMYERFFRACPAYGERSDILRKALSVIIRIKEKEKGLEKEFEEEWIASND